MKKLLGILVISFFAYSALASTSGSYRSNPEGLLTGGGAASATTYSTGNAIGDNLIGTASNSTYSTDLGIMAASISYASREAGIPYVNNLKFDGRTIHSGDYVSPTAVITALVTDTASGIDTATSSIEIDGVGTILASLSGSSSYNVNTGDLVYVSPTPFSNGSHTLTISARNISGVVATLTLNFNIDKGETRVTSAVLIYPNPFNPNKGPSLIAYQLTKDTKVTIYILNSLAQIVWKREFLSGTEGGHIGYNAIQWDGQTDFGAIASNDIYLVRLVADGKVIGKGRIAVLK